MNHKIFISIASYRDNELENTIRSLYKNARYPGRLIFGICLQDTNEYIKEFRYRYCGPQFKIISVNYEEGKGCCWARQLVQTLKEDETYYLQIDAHHRFVQDWDVICEEMLQQCLRKSNKAVISTYATICSKEGANDLDGFTVTHGHIPFRMNCEKFYDFQKVRYIPEEVPNWKNLQEPQLWHTISAHFIFTTGNWANEIPYDPNLYFDGEEDTLGVRSWTNGWDIYYPHKIVTYHYYIRKDAPRHCGGNKDWWKKDKISKEKLIKIWDGTIKDEYGLGDVRTLEQYKEFSGVDYVTKTIKKNDKIVYKPTQKELKNKEVDYIIKYDNTKFEVYGNKWKEIANNGEYTYILEKETNEEWIIKDKERNMSGKIMKTNKDLYLKSGNADWFKFKTNGNLINNDNKGVKTGKLIENNKFIIKYDNYYFEVYGNKWIQRTTNADFIFELEKETNEEWIIKDKGRNMYGKIMKNNKDLYLKCNDGDWFKYDTNGRINESTNNQINVKNVTPRITKGTKRIGVITLGTPNMKEMLKYSRANQLKYCLKHKYSFIQYDESLVDFKIVTWNKVYAIKKHLKDYKWLMWIDSDAVFTNKNITIESIINEAESNHLLVCDDIGGWKLNTGVMLFKNCDESHNLINEWIKMEHKPHSQAAEQGQLIKLLENKNGCKIFPRQRFNQHPKEHKETDYVLHMMGYSGEDRIKQFKKYINS